MKSTTERSLKELKHLKYIPSVVEKWNAFAGIRQDLYGVIDIVAIRSDVIGVLGIQSTTMDNMSKRLNKIAANNNAKIWIQAKNKLEIWGWAKRGPRGERKEWTLKRRAIELIDFPGTMVNGSLSSGSCIQPLG